MALQSSTRTSPKPFLPEYTHWRYFVPWICYEPVPDRPEQRLGSLSALLDHHSRLYHTRRYCAMSDRLSSPKLYPLAPDHVARLCYCDRGNRGAKAGPKDITQIKAISLHYQCGGEPFVEESSPRGDTPGHLMPLGSRPTAVQIPVYDGKNFIWDARVRSYLAAINASSAIEDDVAIEEMDSKALQADNLAKGVIVGHVNNLMMFTLNMFDRAYDMYGYLE
ncbi:hypothetical protein V1525DRAFT_441154 [Lipomyces kononenkoae]|uniref:Uncharacterized protein n=1 Tax=Lipomyces kononenkoae TaxID=34357 RepID=A0ACC3T2I8_LIPKO